MNKFQDRKDRLKRIVNGMLLSCDTPLLSESQLSETHFNNMRNAVNYYIWVSLINAFPKDTFTLSPHVLYYYEDWIAKLPNVTPNGLVLPKQENFLAYHEIHRAVANLLDHYKMSDKIASIHNPINIRLVRGNQDVSNRPKASTKLHTDIWAGEFANSMMVFIPLMGDISNIGVEFYEPPQEFYPDYVRALEDYNEGAHFIETSEKYDCPLRNGFVYFMDPFLLHKTFKRSDKWRLSLDFRFQPTEELESDLKLHTKRDENYIPYDEWRNVGRTSLLYTDTPIGKIDQAEANAYAASYKILTLKA